MRMIGTVLMALLMSGPAVAQDTPATGEAPAAAEATPPASSPSSTAEKPSVGVPESIRGHIAEVKFNGLRRVEEAAMLAAVGMRAGELVSTGKVQRDLIAVYETGFIEDVSVDVSPAPGDPVHGQPQVIVTFELQEKPAIRDTLISGNKKIDEEGLREVIFIDAFAVLNQADIKDSIAAMRDLYLEKGFYLVDIEPIVHEVDEDVVEVEFKIKENKKVRVQRINIVGNDEVPDRKLKKFMQTKEAGIMPWLSSCSVNGSQSTQWVMGSAYWC